MKNQKETKQINSNNFYEVYEDFLKKYDQLVKAGVAKERKSIDYNIAHPFASFNDPTTFYHRGMSVNFNAKGHLY